MLLPRVIEMETLDLGLAAKPAEASPAPTTDTAATSSSESVNSAGNSNSAGDDSGEGDGRKRKLDENATAAERAEEDRLYKLMRRTANQPKSSVNGTHSVKIARPVQSMKGHTAFLTFAMCPL